MGDDDDNDDDVDDDDDDDDDDDVDDITAFILHHFALVCKFSHLFSFTTLLSPNNSWPTADTVLSQSI